MKNEFAPERTLSLGFIGGGLSSAVGQTHYSACHLDGRWRLDAGVFSRYEAVNKRTALSWHVDTSRAHADIETFITNEAGKLDAVAILTPTPAHAHMVRHLLDAGFAVICEKALAMDPGEIDLIRQSYDPSRNFLAVTFNYSGYAMVRELKARIAAGELGQIRQIQIEMPQEGLTRPPAIAGQSAPPQNWRLKDGIVPTICLDLGVHMHHLSRFLVEERPTHVMAEFGNHSCYAGLVDNVMTWQRYASGMQSAYWMTKTAIGQRNGLKLRIYGTEGSAEWLQIEPEELRLAFKDGTRCIIDRGGKASIAQALRYNRMKAGHPSGFIEAFANLYSDIADGLIEYGQTGWMDNAYVPTFEEAAEGITLFAAARRAYEKGTWVKLDHP